MTRPPISLEESLLGGRASVLRAAGFSDGHGILVPFALPDLPFIPQRMFVVSGVASGTTRGKHAHRTGSQLLVCASGVVNVELRAAGDTAQIVLSEPTTALLIGPNVWTQQTYGGPETALLVFASEPYSPGSYVEDPD